MPPALVRQVSLTVTLLAALLVPNDARAKPRHHADAASTSGKRAKVAASEDAGERGAKRRGALSTGSPNHGKLEGGLRLKPTSHLKVRSGAHAWALPTMTKALHHAADRVASKYKGSVLLVGDLSAKSGGALEGHASHQSGRDADVAFFVANTKGKPAHLRRFLSFNAEGTSKDVAWARFDDARNWMLVEELLKDEHAGVRFIFVSNALRGRLLKYAASKKVPKELVARASAALMSPEHADLHDDHFHVRIACPESMRAECIEEPGTRDGAAAAATDAPTSSEAPAAPADPPAGGDPY